MEWNQGYQLFLKKNYRGFVAERIQWLQQTRRMAEQDSNEASKKYKEVHEKLASKHNLEIGDKVLIDNQLFVAKNKKLSWVFNNMAYDFADQFKEKFQVSTEPWLRVTDLAIFISRKRQLWSLPDFYSLRNSFPEIKTQVNFFGFLVIIVKVNLKYFEL